MNELATNFTYGPINKEDALNKNVSIKALLKIAKEHDCRLKSCFELLKSKYEQLLATHNLDEIRECMIRLNETHVTVTQILKELVRSERSIHSQLPTNHNAETEQFQNPVIVLPTHVQQVNEVGQRVMALQKELNAFCSA